MVVSLSDSVLICDIDVDLAQKLNKVFTNASYFVATAQTGKCAQVEISKKKFKIIIVDIDLKNTSSFDLLTFIRINSPASRVIFTYTDKLEAEDLGLLDEKMSSKLGICTMVKKPYSDDKILDVLRDDPAERKWQESIRGNEISFGDATTLSDAKFTKIAISEIYLGSTTLFDFYIRVGKDKYLKFLNKGEAFSRARLKEYEEKKDVENLYFMTKDRGEYIEFMNKFLTKYLKRRKIYGVEALAASKGLIDHFVSEVYLKGLDSKLTQQTKELCDNLYNIVKNDKSTGALINALFEENPEKISYMFLTSFFANITLSGMQWGGELSGKYVIQGALLHEIGKLNLPDEIRGKAYEELTAAQKLIYESYPTEGFNLLSGTSVPQQVKQIINQHREFINGKGYPNGLTGQRIFPLAKIVCFASSFAEFVISKNTTPIKAMRDFIKSREQVTKYDSECIKSFIGCMVKNK